MYKLLTCFQQVPQLYKHRPHFNSLFHHQSPDHHKYFEGKVLETSGVCVLSCCAGKCPDYFLKLVKGVQDKKLSLCSVYLRNGGDCGNPKCPGHTCSPCCPLHSWDENGKMTNIFDNPEARALLKDRSDLNWKTEKCLEKYRDWGTAHNRCPYCGYRHQVWYMYWKRNIKKWLKQKKKNGQIGIFLRYDKTSELGYGQQDEFRYLKKHNYCFLDLTIDEFDKTR